MTTIHKPQHTGLSVRAAKMLDFITQYKQAHDGNAPTLREIGDAAGVSSTSLISYYIDELARAGKIRRAGLAARQIELIGGRYIPPGVEQ